MGNICISQCIGKTPQQYPTPSHPPLDHLGVAEEPSVIIPNDYMFSE